MLSTHEIDATLPARGSVIWMHGLGATNHDFDAVVPELQAADLRFLFPQAPLRPVTINGGAQMPAWYDILSLDDPPLREDAAHVRESEREISSLIERERERGVPASRIVLAGFSQGGAMALHVGLRSPEALAGILVLSGYLLLPDQLARERHPKTADSALLFCHGRFDPVVPLELARRAHESVCRAGYAATFEEYPMQHELCLDEIRSIAGWLGQVCR